MLTPILLLNLSLFLPHESWLNNQFEEFLLRTRPAVAVFPGTKPYSFFELLKYVETSSPRDRTAYLLEQRVEKYIGEFVRSIPRKGFGGGFKFRSDSTSRAFLTPHFFGKTDGLEIFLEATLKVGKTDEWPNRTWEDVGASDYMRAYFKTEFKRLTFLFGRESLKWGASPSSPLLLSGGSPPFDMVYIDCRSERFKFSSFFTILDSDGDISRYLTGHRIELGLFSKFFVGLSELVIHGGPNALPDPYYLNPLVVFYPREWNVGRSRANILWGLDLNYFGKGWGVYGEFMVDDYPYEVTSWNEHPKLGWILGFRMLDLIRAGEYITTQYEGVTRWCYGHLVPWQRYTYLGYPIGHPLGDDFDRISVNLTEHLAKSLDLEMSTHYTRKGEGKISESYPEDRFPDDYFLTGVVEKRIGLSLGIRYLSGSVWTVELQCGWEKIDNHRNRPEISSHQPSIHFRLEKLL